MRDYEPENFFGTIFSCEGSVMPKVLLRAVLIGGASGALAAWIESESCGDPGMPGHADDCLFGELFGPILVPEKPHVPSWTSYIGVFVGLLLVFKTNLAYSRIDHGTALMGALSHDCRTIASQACGFIGGDVAGATELREELCRLSLLLMVLVVRRICDSDSELVKPGGKLAQFESELLAEGEAEKLEAVKAATEAGACYWTDIPTDNENQVDKRDADSHIPVLALWCRTRLQRAFKENRISAPMQGHMDSTITGFLINYQGLRKIATVPIPFPYAQMVKICLLMYLTAAPFFMVADYKWLTVPLNILLSMVLLGIDEISVEIEDPFGDDPNDINLLKVLRKMDADVSTLLAAAHQFSPHQRRSNSVSSLNGVPTPVQMSATASVPGAANPSRAMKPSPSVPAPATQDSSQPLLQHAPTAMPAPAPDAAPAAEAKVVQTTFTRLAQPQSGGAGGGQGGGAAATTFATRPLSPAHSAARNTAQAQEEQARLALEASERELLKAQQELAAHTGVART